MRDYIKPIIEEEVIELEDIIAASSPTDPMSSPANEFDPDQPGDGLIL